MTKVQIISKKYDGTLRDRCESFLCREDEEGWVVYTPPGTDNYDHRHRSHAEVSDGILGLYFKARWYVVWHICEQNLNINRAYAHLSTPTRMTENGLEWVDLDLDYRIHLDGRLERLDEEEYEQNREVMGYPLELSDRVKETCKEIEALYGERAFPFNHDEQVALYRLIERKAVKGYVNP